ncbi:Sphingosine kinase 2 [Halocaridina rubra]|uniref:Sphingosine kinase 2 n=1 Tax=Halocaridina rubra TaxID=373956 RepID=A0AAN8WTI6_HALRR
MANPVLVSTLNLAYGYTSPMDLVLIQTPSDQKLSFLSIGLGLLSDIDIESERLRSIGETRFTIWALARIANMRRYHAKVSFKRSQANISNNNHNIRHILRRSQTVEAESELGRAGLGNQMIRSQSAIAGEDEFCPPLMKADPCSFNEDDHLESRETTSLESTDNFKSGDLSSNGRSNYLQPKLQEPVPEDWETIEDDFVILYACYQTHMGSDIFLAPEATLNDGVIWLLLVRGHATKASITKFLLAMDGSHVNIQGVEMFPVEAFRIEPSGKTGYLTVDGEKIQWGPLQAQILPSKGNIISR